MVNDVRNYSSTTRSMSLLGAVDTSAETVTLDTLQGLPTPPFTLILSAGTTTEELVLATDISGSTITVERAQAGTTARAHIAGAPVLHGLSGQDLQEFQDHVQATEGVHGATGALVDTASEQEVTNKTISGATNTITDLDGATALASGSVPDSALGEGIDADTVGGRHWTVSETEPLSPTIGDLWVDIS